MRYLSVFSGIEATSVAWQPLGWDFAVLVVAWIGRRIQLVTKLEQENP